MTKVTKKEKQHWTVFFFFTLLSYYLTHEQSENLVANIFLPLCIVFMFKQMKFEADLKSAFQSLCSGPAV